VPQDLPLPPPSTRLASSETLDDPRLSSKDRWLRAAEYLRQKLPRPGMSLSFGRLVSIEPGQVRLAFPSDAAFHRSTVAGSGKEALEKELSEYFACPTRILAENHSPVIATIAPSPVEEQARTRAEREGKIEEKVRSHPVVLASLRILGGNLEHIEVLEREDDNAGN
jgi:hypothetical protein